MTQKNEQSLVERLWEAVGYHSAQIAETGDMAPSEKLLEAMKAVEQLEAQLKPQDELPELVTLESAQEAIEYVGQYNGPGREAEACRMLVRATRPTDAQPVATKQNGGYCADCNTFGGEHKEGTKCDPRRFTPTDAQQEEFQKALHAGLGQDCVDYAKRRQKQPAPALTDEQWSEVKDRCASAADDWADGLSYEPTKAQVDAFFCKALLQAAQPLGKPSVETCDIPEGYALVSKEALRMWGKYDEVSDACVYIVDPTEAQPQGEKK